MKTKAPSADMKATRESLLMAHRYLYYVLARPVLTDAAYDQIERDFLKDFPRDKGAMRKPGSSLADSYSEQNKRTAEMLTRRARACRI